MAFSLQTDYALRTMMFLASRKGRVKVADVASFYGISVPHVAKVVNQLSRIGYIRSIRGAGGGIEMVKDPAKIRLGEIVLAFEGNLHLLECVGTEGICTIQSYCKLRGVLAHAERLQLDYLNKVHLSDVIPV